MFSALDPEARVPAFQRLYRDSGRNTYGQQPLSWAVRVEIGSGQCDDRRAVRSVKTGVSSGGGPGIPVGCERRTGCSGGGGGHVWVRSDCHSRSGVHGVGR
jgi:hypothetical protein